MVRRRAKSWCDHPPVLALSIGGSNTGVMLAENRDGILHIHTAKRVANPDHSTPFFQFLDDILWKDTAYAAYLRESTAPAVGISVAVPFADGVPFHSSKLPTIEGLVARDTASQRSTHHLPTRFKEWLQSRAGRSVVPACEGDAPVAHLGGLASTRMDSDMASLLFVCGTGMACADDSHFILPGLFPVLSEIDPQLYPREICEGGQFQYLCAGKGIFRMLRQALILRAAESGSPLAGAADPAWLTTAADSKHVYKLWAAWQGEDLSPPLNRIRDSYVSVAWKEVMKLAALVAGRAIEAMAASIVATLVDQQLTPGRGVALVFEGSIARNTHVQKALTGSVSRMQAAVKSRFQIEMPEILWRFEADYRPMGESAALAAYDQTLHGAAAMIMARTGRF